MTARMRVAVAVVVRAVIGIGLGVHVTFARMGMFGRPLVIAEVHGMVVVHVRMLDAAMRLEVVAIGNMAFATDSAHRHALVLVDGRVLAAAFLHVGAPRVGEMLVGALIGFNEVAAHRLRNAKALGCGWIVVDHLHKPVLRAAGGGDDCLRKDCARRGGNPAGRKLGGSTTIEQHNP